MIAKMRKSTLAPLAARERILKKSSLVTGVEHEDVIIIPPDRIVRKAFRLSFVYTPNAFLILFLFLFLYLLLQLKVAPGLWNF